MSATRSQRCSAMIKSKLFTQEQIKWIQRAYKKYARAEMTKRFNKKFDANIKVTQMATFVQTKGIKSGRTGQFNSGHETWNKGTKGVMKASSTSFKKGINVHNALPVGSHRINKDGHSEFKVAEPRRWLTEQRLIWEYNHGPIPEKHVVRFIDGDYRNCDINNLFLVSCAENLQLNKLQYSKQPDALKESTLLIAKIIAKTHALGKV